MGHGPSRSNREQRSTQGGLSKRSQDIRKSREGVAKSLGATLPARNEAELRRLLKAGIPLKDAYGDD